MTAAVVTVGEGECACVTMPTQEISDTELTDE